MAYSIEPTLLKWLRKTVPICCGNGRISIVIRNHRIVALCKRCCSWKPITKQAIRQGKDIDIYAS